jgi:hypothetical protein
MKQSLFLICVLCTTIFVSCNLFGERIYGNGNVRTENRSIDNFTGVDVRNNIDLHIVQGPEYTVRIETDENLMEHIEVRVSGNKLRIGARDHANLNPSRSIKVFVSAPAYRTLGASGACKIYADSKIVSKDPLELDLSGASHMTLELNAPRVVTGLSGASSVELRGETKDLRIDGSGASEVRGYDLLAENVEVDLSGACNAEVFASTSLKAGLSGASHVHYKGNASVNQNTSGASGVKKVN